MGHRGPLQPSFKGAILALLCGVEMSSFADLKARVLGQCRREHVGLWWIVEEVRHRVLMGEILEERTAQDPPDAVQGLTLRLLEELLASGRIQAGFPAADGVGFRRSTEPLATLLARIRTDWDALGRDPALGEVIWLTSTD